MRTIRSIPAMQLLAKAWKQQSRSIAFVPTMGCLHAGHRDLMREARRCAGPRGRVVLSIFVNPLQFGPGEDLARYPRTLSSDARLSRATGVDVLFIPTTASLYRGGRESALSTFVQEETLSKTMEGAARPTHFKGVTTVVCKLFNIVLPDLAVFGAKDFQQAAVIQRMTRDLNFPVRIVVVPTRRESDGLAMSSRNRYLSPNERLRAVSLWQAIGEARRLVRRSPTKLASSNLKRFLVGLMERQPGVRVDYVHLFDPVSFRSVSRVQRGVHLAIAAFVGKTRLIDNARL